MRFVVSRDALVSAVTSVKDTIGTDLPVLAGVMMEVGDRATFTTSDMRSNTVCTVPAVIEDGGRAVVPHRRLLDLAKRLPDKPVSLVLDGNVVNVACGRTRAKLMTVPPDDFPPVESARDVVITLPGDVVSEIDAMVRPFVGSDPGKPVLDGIHVMSDGARLSVEATDSYRAVSYEVETECQVAEVLIPSKAFSTAARASTGDMTVACTDGRVTLSSGGFALTAQVPSGAYPDIARIMPDGHGATATLDAGEMVDALGRMMVYEPMSVLVSLGTDGVTLSSTGSEGGAVEVVPAGCDATGLEVALNCKYLREAMRALDGDVEMTVLGNVNPVLISQGCDGRRYRHLLMPVYR